MSVETHDARVALVNLEAAIGHAAREALRAAVLATAESVQGTSLYKDRSGGTRGSLQKGVVGYTGFVESGGATRLLENGTVPHVIQGRGGGMLRFVMNGAVMFRRSVNHPGTSPRPFMAVARAIGEQAADYGGEFFVDEAIAKYDHQ